MKVLDFETSLSDIENGKLELADITKTWLYQHAPQWLDILDFEDDATFLEPSLFYFFRKLMQKETPPMPLDQVLWAYTPIENRPKIIDVFTDADGVIYLPNLGNITTNTEGSTKSNKKTITISSDCKSVLLEGVQLNIEPRKLLKNNQFLCTHKPDIYQEMN